MRINGSVCALLVIIMAGCGARRMTPVVNEEPQRVEIAVGSKVCDLAPSFELLDTDGRTVSLESYRGKATVLVFYRGEW